MPRGPYRIHHYVFMGVCMQTYYVCMHIISSLHHEPLRSSYDPLVPLIKSLGSLFFHSAVVAPKTGGGSLH